MPITSLPPVRGFLKKHSGASQTGRRIAAFDCDGTIIRGDIGEAMLYRQIDRFFFRRSPAEIWKDYPRRETLHALYTSLATTPEEERPTSEAFDQFAKLVLDWYFDQINDGAVAKACTDIVRLFSGFSADEVRRFAEETFLEAHALTLGRRTLGGRSLPAGIRYIRESVELIEALKAEGFEVWAISGSNKWSVEPVLARLGVPKERVIGIELTEVGGLCTAQEINPVPIRERKVEALRKRIPHPPLLSASDSKNDIPLLLYASELRVRINSRGRDTADFFRTVGTTPDDSWVLVEHLTLVNEGDPLWPMLQ
jgi:phosphoserine phosphatase